MSSRSHTLREALQGVEKAASVERAAIAVVPLDSEVFEVRLSTSSCPSEHEMLPLLVSAVREQARAHLDRPFSSALLEHADGIARALAGQAIRGVTESPLYADQMPLAIARLTQEINYLREKLEDYIVLPVEGEEQISP